MKRLLLLSCLARTVLSVMAQSQPFGNEWVNFSQTYVKIPVAQNGLYRVNTADLQKAGVPTNTLNPVTLQLFHRGVEQAIYVEGETDGKFDTADFLEFYGRGNDGTQDSVLYRPMSAQPHKYYSLFSDTTAYFLTWRLDGKPGKRMATYTDTDTTGLAAEPYHWEEELRLFTQTYPAGNIYPMGASYGNSAILTGYDVGEGWTGPVVNVGGRYDQTFTLTNATITPEALPTARYLLVGRNAGRHQVDYLAGASGGTLRTMNTATFENYDNQLFETRLEPTDVSTSGNVVLSIQPRQDGEQVSVSYLLLRYPQRIDLGGRGEKLLRLPPNKGGRSLLVATNVPNDSRFFDVSDPTAPRLLRGAVTNGQWRSGVPNSQTSRTIFATNRPMRVLQIRPVTFQPINRNNANYLIITHPALRQPTAGATDPVRAYAAYRASAAGGGYDTLTINIDQVFDQFSYGERNAVAIRRFADYMTPGGTGPKFLFLIGQSRDPQGIRKNPNGALLDMVPNAGWPGSDIGLVEGLNKQPEYVPGLAIGRLNTTRPQQVLDYLNKVREHENTAEPALWRKNILHLSGGQTAFELRLFRSFLDDFGQVIENRYVGGRLTTLGKQTNNPVETLPVVTDINAGVGMISMFGHSGLDVADVDIGFCSDDRLGYRNQGRYPFILANGCAAGNFYFGRPTFGSDWILTPNRGAVLFIAHTYNGFIEPLKGYSDAFYTLFADSNYVGKPIGLLQQEAIRHYLQKSSNVYDVTTSQQMTLQGDPAVAPFPLSKPDFGVVSGTLRLAGSRGDTLSSASDSVMVSGIVANYGRVTGSPMVVRIRRYAADGKLIREQRYAQAAPFYADTLRWLLANDRAVSGVSYFELTIDPDNRIDELTRVNNTAQISTTGTVTALPFSIDRIPPIVEVAFDGQRIEDNDLVSAKPLIDVMIQDENRQLIRTDTTNIELYIQRPCATGQCPYERLRLGGNNVRWLPAGADNSFRLTYQPSAPLADGLYGFEVIGSDLSGNRAAPYQIHFRVRNQPELTAAGVYPNPFTRQTRLFVRLSGQTPPADLSVQIRDLSGRLVKTLRTTARVGLNEWLWDGTSDAGDALPAGIYLYQFTGTDLPPAPEAQLTGRLVLNR